ncbi:MAG TPA: hypothetical protein VF796_17010 [Humisphaera sp.]
MAPPIDPGPVPIDPDAGDASFVPPADRRPTLPEPPPVRLVAVADVVLVCPPGVEREMDAFYVGLLRFEREDEPPAKPRLVEPVLGGDVPAVTRARRKPPLPELPERAMQGPVYRAERFRVSVHVFEPPIGRDTLRPVQIEVPSLPVVRHWVEEHEVEHTIQKGIVPGRESILLQDPGGNWVEVSEMKPI